MSRRGLVGHWKYHGDVYGNTWKNYAPETEGTNNGAFNGSVYVDEDNGAVFDGDINNNIFLGSISGFDTNNFTMLTWIYTLDSINSHTVLCSDQIGGWQFRLSGQKINLVKTNIVEIFTANTALDINKWYLIAVTKNGNDFKAYVDGVLDYSTTSAQVGSDYPLYMGRHFNITSNTVNGYLNNVQIYNTALNQTQITDIYNAGRQAATLPASCPVDNLVAWYSSAKSGEVSVNTRWYDISGNGNNGSLNGDAFIDNQGASFDGSGDYVSISSATQITNNFSFVLWAKPDTATFMGVCGDRSGSNPSFTIYKESDGRPRVTSIPNGSDIACSTQILATGVYSFLAVTIEYTTLTTLKFYSKDGLVQTNTFGGQAYSFSSNFKIGDDGQVVGNDFDGNINDFGIYNRTLSAEEIKQIYYQEKGRYI